jgi:hypothetical protein
MMTHLPVIVKKKGRAFYGFFGFFAPTVTFFTS